jgi:uncharacterized protein (TIGR02246 family)
MRKIVLVAAILLALVTIGCQTPAPQPAPGRTADQVQADAEALRAKWVEMANAGNAAGLASLYTEDAVYTDPYGAVHQGRAAIEAYFTQSFTRVAGYDIKMDATSINGDVAIGHGTWSAKPKSPEGAPPIGGRWINVNAYQPDGTPKIRWSLSMIPAPVPGT